LQKNLLHLHFFFTSLMTSFFFGHTGPTSQKYQEVFLSRLLSCVTSSQPEVRQAAAYGCGVLGQFGGPGYAQGSKAPPSSLYFTPVIPSYMCKSGTNVMASAW
jgi:hypothetical protein